MPMTDENRKKLEKAMSDFVDKAKSMGLSMANTCKNAIEESSVLLEAQGLVHGERREQHGNPGDVYSITAELWSAYLGAEIKTRDVPAMMIMLKLARGKDNPNRETWLDSAGYSECGSMIDEHRG